MIANSVLWEGSFSFRPESISAVRRQIRRVLDTTGFVSEVVDTAVLLASELSTNAVQYGHGRARTAFDVRLVAAATGLYLEVADGNQKMPVPRKPHPRREGGRGLLLLSLLGHKWGVTLDADTGKHTWVLVLAQLPDEVRAAARIAHRRTLHASGVPIAGSPQHPPWHR